MVGGKTIYVGLDDSNHAGQGKKGEIILATFSTYKQDSKVQQHPNRRMYNAAQNWMEDEQRDYRFAVLALDKYRKTSQNNIFSAAPALINNFIKYHTNYFDIANIYIDGRMRGEQKTELKYEIRTNFKEIIIDNFTKSKKIHKCPKVVWMAHLWAGLILTETSEKMLSHEKLVFVD